MLPIVSQLKATEYLVMELERYDDAVIERYFKPH